MSHLDRYAIDIEDHYVSRNLLKAGRLVVQDKMLLVYVGFLSLMTLLAVVGPMLAPYSANETQYLNGQVLRGTAPSLAHPLGTTALGYDVLSQVMIGARPTMISGFLGGTIIITISLLVGVTAGYVGGVVENVLMRFTDLMYSVPLIPFAIVLLTFLGVGFIQSVVVIGLLLWRGNARVLRSQVLQIKERPFVTAAKSTGASTPYVIYKHILPNIAPMVVLFFALGIGYSIILQAGLAFIGVSNPFIPSWGVMIRNAYNSGLMSVAWWWALSPGILISLTVLSAFMIGRKYESLAGSGEDDAFVEAG